MGCKKHTRGPQCRGERDRMVRKREGLEENTSVWGSEEGGRGEGVTAGDRGLQDVIM